MKNIDRAQIIAKVAAAMELLTEAIDLLMPEGEEAPCNHPPEQIEHDPTMDDEQSTYKCKKCGAVQSTPFHEET